MLRLRSVTYIHTYTCFKTLIYPKFAVVCNTQKETSETLKNKDTNDQCDKLSRFSHVRLSVCIYASSNSVFEISI